MNSNLRILQILILFTAIQLAAASDGEPRISLAGRWRLQLDRNDAGIKDRWFESSLAQHIKLPGSLPEQGIGDAISLDTKWTGDIVDRSWFTASEYARYRQAGNIKLPFWLQPETYYSGVAWYQRTIAIPAEWRGKRVILKLERPHWATTVWVDGREIGSNDSLSTPHEYELGIAHAESPDAPEQPNPAIADSGTLALLGPGNHQLTIRVDNRMVVDIGANSHSVSDHTQGNWNGIVGEISLRATPLVWIEDLQAYPSFGSKSVKVKGRIGNSSGKPGRSPLAITIQEAHRSKRASSSEANNSSLVTWEAQGGSFEFELPVQDPSPWNEFQPSLFELEARLAEFGATREVTFGFRDLAAQGTQLALNSSKIFIRGTLECCIFPKTGHPPTDAASWERIVRTAKSHGLNLIRFHSWCPPEAAFVAADELGFYYQVEIASWANQSTTLGDGKPVDDWLYVEASRILKAYGNHPSFLLMPYGNEPGGDHANGYLAKWVTHWKSTDSRRFYTSGSGWPQLPENQFHVTPDPRIQGWGEGLKSRINAQPPETRTDYGKYIQARQVPVISHEIGQWCVYPNFDEIPKYTGYLKPKNFEIFRDSLVEHGLGGLAHQFLICSGKLQTLCYKEDIEAALRTPGMAGFELLDLHDFPGQGTALVGVLDPFWESKGYVTAAQFSRFCNSTVPLARLRKRVFTAEETLQAEIEVAHFGPGALKQTKVNWGLVDDSGRTALSGSLPTCEVPVGNGISLGKVNIGLTALATPARYKFVVRLESASATKLNGRPAYENDWDVWVYPTTLRETASRDVLITQDLNDEARDKLSAGGKVLLVVPADKVKGDKHGKVALGFSSIFWNTAWTGRQPPHTLGILCDPKNPALKEFPTDPWSNWQWWYLIHRAGAMILDDLPRGLQPTVEVIDDWVTNRKLALIFEARVGTGRILVTSIDLKNHLDKDPPAKQLRQSLLNYMASSKFKPAVELTPAQVRSVATVD